jgi:purine-binding chemotaxis protein CheW
MINRSESSASGPVEKGKQYVTFYLNDEVYAVDVLNVQEIIELTSYTNVPHLPDFIKGVINLRGTIVPVVDLKLKFGMVSGDYKKHSCIMITEFSGGVMGLIVDAVSDVVTIPEETIADTPSFGSKVRTEFIKGMGKVDDRLVIILDVEKVLSTSETISLEDAKKFGATRGDEKDS